MSFKQAQNALLDIKRLTIAYFRCTEVACPLLFVSALDDPVVDPTAMPIDVPEKNPNVIVVLTKRGGHLGFLEGWWPTGLNWSDRLMAKFLSSCASLNLPMPSENTLNESQ